MANWNELHAQNIGHLTAATATMHPLVDQFMKAIPAYKSPEWRASYQGAIADLLKVSLPNSGIVRPLKDEVISGWRSSVDVKYTHEGSQTGYRDVFFPGSSRTPAAAAVAAGALEVDTSYNNNWWERYAVAALTDAIRTRVGVNLNAPKLETDILNFVMKLKGVLTATYLAVFREGYGPTAAACRNINEASRVGALADLKSRMSQKRYTDSMNSALEQPGDASLAAEWILFNMWIVLKVLGELDITSFIKQFNAACPNLPNSIGASRWWGGGYTTWIDRPPYGSELLNAASHAITAEMRLTKTSKTLSSASMFGVTPETRSTVSIPNGYSESFCYHGALNWYKA